MAATASVALVTPNTAAQASISVAASGTVPLGGIAGFGAKVLGALGVVKLPYDLAAGSISALVCSL